MPKDTIKDAEELLTRIENMSYASCAMRVPDILRALLAENKEADDMLLTQARTIKELQASLNNANGLIDIAVFENGKLQASLDSANRVVDAAGSMFRTKGFLLVGAKENLRTALASHHNGNGVDDE